MSKILLDEVYLGRILNSYRIFYPSVVYKLIGEFIRVSSSEKYLTIAIEDFLYQKILEVYKENEKKVPNQSYESFNLRKNEVLNIIYFYNISLDKIFFLKVEEINKFITFLEKVKNKSNKNLIEKRKMKRVDISFVPSLQKINKIYLGFSFIIWIILYIIIFYFIYK